VLETVGILGVNGWPAQDPKGQVRGANIPSIPWDEAHGDIVLTTE